MSPNGSPNDPKSMPEAPTIQLFRISENYQKPLFLLWFRHIGPSSFGRFGEQNGDRRADHPPDTQKRRKSRPSAAQGRPNAKSLFGQFSVNFRPRVPRAPRRVPEGRFLTVWGRFWSIWGLFWHDFETILEQFSVIFHRLCHRHRANNESIERSIDRRVGARWRICRRQLYICIYKRI